MEPDGHKTSYYIVLYAGEHSTGHLVHGFFFEELPEKVEESGNLHAFLYVCMEVDFAVQQFIRGHLEELDPVDGTTNLIHDYRASVISLALMQEGSVVLGMIYNPYTDELFSAQKGKGSYCNGQKIEVSGAETMEKCLIAIGTSPYYKEMAEENFKVFQAIFKDCQDIRRSGSAALDLAYVACGRIEAYFERKLKIWDYAAGMLLVREAGGQVTDYRGNDVDTEMISNITAANPKINSLLTKKYLQVAPF